MDKISIIALILLMSIFCMEIATPFAQNKPLTIEKPVYTEYSDSVSQKFMEFYNKQDYDAIWSACGSMLKERFDKLWLVESVKKVYDYFGEIESLHKIEGDDYQRHTIILENVQKFNAEYKSTGIYSFIYCTLFTEKKGYLELIISKENNNYKIQSFNLHETPKLIYYKE